MVTDAEIKSVVDKAGQLLSRFRVPELRERERTLSDQTLQPDFWTRPDAKQTMQALGDVQDDLASVASLQEKLSDIETAQFLCTEEPENTDYCAQLDTIFSELKQTVDLLELKKYLCGKYDHADAIFSVHAGQGGTEAMDWASILARAYTRYFERQGWKYSLIDESRGEEAGVKAISFEVKGKNVYGLLRHEAGTHRLVRLSPFNADSLRQTSFALVEVLPIIDDADREVPINEADLSWHFTRAGGAGGQNVNKVNTAVELTYLPLGLVVRCREERSQAQNKQRALQILRAKLAVMKEEQQAEEITALKAGKTMASWGTQIRNYVLHPYQLVKDTRTGAQTNDTAGVLDGDMNQFIFAALAQLSV